MADEPLLSDAFEPVIRAYIAEYELSRRVAETRVHEELLVSEVVRRVVLQPNVIAGAVSHTEAHTVISVVVSPGSEQAARAYVVDQANDLGLPKVRAVAVAAPATKETIHSARDHMANALDAQIEGSWGMHVDSWTGRIRVSVGNEADGDLHRAIGLLQQTSLEVAQGTSIFDPVEVVASQNTNLAGGGEKMTFTDGGNCTSGFAVKDSNGPAIMTAGHCGNSGVHLIDSSGSGGSNTWIDLGSAFLDGYGPGTRDSQFHRITADAVPDPAVRNASNGARYGMTATRIVQAGQQLCQFGQRSNAQLCGTVISTTHTSGGPEGHPTLTNMILTHANVRGGDSGGPAFDGDRAVGLISRGESCTYDPLDGEACDHSDHTVIQPIGSALAGTGFTLLGNGSDGGFTPLAVPQRIHDSTISGGWFERVRVRGAGGVPTSDNVSGAVLNITTVAPSGNGHINVYPDGQQIPVGSAGNYQAGSVLAHHVTTALVDNDDDIRIRTTSTARIIVDVIGYYRTDTGTSEIDLLTVPIRVDDTRWGVDDPIGPGETYDLLLPSTVPSNAAAVILNVTGIHPTTPTDIAVYSPALSTPPVTSNLNIVPGQVVANEVTAAVQDVGSRAKVRLRNKAGHVNTIVDLLGWYDAAGDVVVPVPHTRVMDTRFNINGSNPIGANQTIDVQIAGLTAVAPLIPTNATGVMLKVVAVNPTAHSHLVVTHSGTATTSTMNLVPGTTRSNSVTVPLNAGDVSIYNLAGQTDLVIDVEGYVYDDW